MLAVVRSPDVAAGQTAAVGAAAAAVLAAFVAVEHRTAIPLVRLGILRRGSVRRANLGALLWVGS